MKVIKSDLIVILLICPALLVQTGVPIAEKILTIGPGSAEGPYLFLGIEDVKADSAGNIFVLDSVRARVVKFSPNGEFLSAIGRPLIDVTDRNEKLKNLDLLKSKLKESRESDELYYPKAFCLAENGLYIADQGKFVQYSAEGAPLGVIPWKVRINFRGAFLNGRGEVVLLGNVTGRDQIFHVLDGEGNIERSYGESFKIQSERAVSIPDDQEKDRILSLIGLPVSYCLGPRGEALVLNPFGYEIRVYWDDSLRRTVTCAAKYSSGFAGVISHSIAGKSAGFSIGNIAPPVILGKDDMILVFQADDRGTADGVGRRNFRVDVFKNYEYQKTLSLTLEGYPKGLGLDGRLFTVGTGTRQFVNVYALNF
jgi:hypothetical protein